MLLKLKRADNLAQAPEFHTRTQQLERLRLLAEDILSRKECFTTKQLSVNGHDLIWIGFKPGKELGVCLSKLLDEVMEGRLENDRETLISAAKKMLSDINA